MACRNCFKPCRRFAMTSGLTHLQKSQRGVALVTAMLVVSLVTDPSGELLSGDSLTDTVKQLVDLGVSAICLNCIPWWYVDVALDRLLATTNLPVGIYANLGRPTP